MTMKGNVQPIQCVLKDSFIHSLFSFLPPFLQPILTKHLLPRCFGRICACPWRCSHYVSNTVRYQCVDEHNKQDPCPHWVFRLAEDLKCKQVIKECVLGAIGRLTSPSRTSLLREVLPKEVINRLTPEGIRGICQLEV